MRWSLPWGSAHAAGGMTASRSPFRSILGNASLLLGGRATTGLFSLVYIALAARGLGIEEFGILILVHTYAQTIGDFAEFKSWQAVLQFGVGPYKDGRTADLQRVVRFSLLLDLIGAVGGLMIALVSVWFLSDRFGWSAEVAGMSMMYSTSILFMSTTTPIGVLRLMNRFDLIAIQTTISSLVRLIGSPIAYVFHGGLVGFLTVWYLSTVFAFGYMVVSAVVVMHRNGSAAGFRWRAPRPFTQDMPGAWPFVWNINLNSALGLATTKVALLVVGFYFGPREAALFRIARQVSDAAVRPTKLLVPALYPELARLWAERDLPRLRRLCLQLGASAGLVASAALLILAVFGGPLIRLVVGPGYEGATGIMLWLFGASVIGIWGLPMEPLLISTGRSATALRVRAAVAVAYLAALFPAMDHYGLTGAGVAALGASALIFVLQLTALLRQSWAPAAGPSGLAAAAGPAAPIAPPPESW